MVYTKRRSFFVSVDLVLVVIAANVVFPKPPEAALCYYLPPRDGLECPSP
jgi:hypothetical protein